VKAVFVDTSGFYAFLDGTDAHHAEARECFRLAVDSGWRLQTTSYVVHESWAVIQARLGWQAVDAWIDDVLGSCEVQAVEAGLLALGAARCRQARVRSLSLTDCVSIEFMRQHGLRDAIAFDEHFAREGFRLPSLGGLPWRLED
jgi:predicted nucleic acid-binding protein